MYSYTCSLRLALCALALLFGMEGGGMMLGKIGSANLMYHGLTARSYVQSGLIAMWDGIENAGWGVHDSAATTWKDLTGNGHDIMFYSACCDILPNGLTGKSIATSPNKWGECLGDAGGIQGILFMESVIRCSSSVYSIMACFGTRTSIGRKRAFLAVNVLNSTAYLVVDASNGTRLMGPQSNGFTGTLSAKYADDSSGVVTNVWANSLVVDNHLYTGGNNTDLFPYPTIGGRGSTGTSLSNITIHGFRLYSRALAAEEIAENHAVDKARFNLP